MRPTGPKEELRDVDSSSNTTMTHEKLISEGGIAGSIDSSTHDSTDEDSHVQHSVEIVVVRKVSSHLTEDEKATSNPDKVESSKPNMTAKEELLPSKPNKTTKKKLLRGLFGPKRGKTKPPKPQSHQKQKEATSINEPITPYSSLSSLVEISVETKSNIEEEVEPLMTDPEKGTTTSGSVTDAESHTEDEPACRRIVEESDLCTPAQEDVGDTEVIALPKVGEVSVDGPTLSMKQNTESFDETIEKALETNSVVPDDVEKVNILDKAGMKVDALVDAFFLMTACDAACNQGDRSAYEDTVLTKGTGDDYTLRTDSCDDSYLTFDNSLIDDDETLRTFLGDDGTFRDDDAQLSSEDVKRAIETLKKHALRHGISEAELLQRSRDKQEKRANENTRESTLADTV